MKANHPTLRPGGLHAAGLLLAVLGAASGTLLPSAGADCEDEWVISDEQHMGQDETYECVHILPTGRLYTNQYKLTITGGGGLTIDTGGKLFVNNASGQVVLTGGGTSTVNGRIYIRYNGSELEIDDNDHTLTGSGKIIGENNGAQITIVGVTLTSEITIEGALTVQATSRRRQLAGADFVNNGLIEANRANETLTVYDGTFSSGFGEWKVVTSGATLKFREGVSTWAMGGSFTLSESAETGTLDIDECVQTSGSLTGNTANIDVAPTKRFCYSGGSVDGPGEIDCPECEE